CRWFSARKASIATCEISTPSTLNPCFASQSMSSDFPHSGTSTRVPGATSSAPQCFSSSGITDSWCHPVRPSRQRCNQYSVFIFRFQKACPDGTGIQRRAQRVHENAWLALGLVANHFDVVPIRPDDERGVIFAAVVRAQAGRAIVLAARRQSRAMESFDLLAICGDERQVKMRRFLRGLEKAQ